MPGRGFSGLTAAFQPRRLMSASAAVGCKRLLALEPRCSDHEVLNERSRLKQPPTLGLIVRSGGCSREHLKCHITGANQAEATETVDDDVLNFD